MPRVEYERCDLPVAITQSSHGIIVRVGAAAHVRERSIQFEQLLQKGFPKEMIDKLFVDLPIGAFSWHQSLPDPKQIKQIVLRLTLNIHDAELSMIDWEALLRPATAVIGLPGYLKNYLPSWIIVRASVVRPRFLNLPLTLPLRILQLNPRLGHSIPQWVRSLFGSRPHEQVEQAVVVNSTFGWTAPSDWATVDVLHVDSLPYLNAPEELLATVEPDRPGTLGWFVRWTDRMQTRLVILHSPMPNDRATARLLARALCDKGGPAILVAGGPNSIMESFYRHLYDGLIHDSGIDVALTAETQATAAATLFVGGGREDGVRVSNVGLALIELATAFSTQEIAEGSAEIKLTDLAARYSVHPTNVSIQSIQFREGLTQIEGKWNSFQFDLHESDGLLPLANDLEGLRQVLLPSKVFPPPRSRAERFVNASIWSEGDGNLRLIEQSSAVLETGSLYQLAVALGPKDLRIDTINTTAIFEEVFKWTPDQPGVWVEVGVTGIDFDVIGDPVQELWLPQYGSTEPLYFAVSPRVAGVAQLRFGIYFQQNLIQSFRMAALTHGAGDGPADGTSALAKALSVPRYRIANAGYMARLEYSRTSLLDRLHTKSGRCLSITANKLNGQDVLTIKGADLFSVVVRPDDEIPMIVSQIRDTLNDIAYTQGPGLEQQYQFGPYVAPGVLDDRFKKALVKLASAGFRLFNNLVPDPKTRDVLAKILSGERKTIHVAQLLRKKMIPWTFVYDRLYDEDTEKLQGKEVAAGVCLAALPEAGNSFRATECALHQDCLLNPERQAERKQKGSPLYAERTVACPLHFWGFRHIIEVPPQQVEDDSDTGHEEKVSIVPKGSLQLAAGLNETLPTCTQHWESLCKIRNWGNPEYDRDRILDLLRNRELDFIYFFCHAEGGEANPKIDPPYLEFQTLGGIARAIRPQDLSDNMAWDHGPLIFLNACGTLGYSPDALSPFLKTLVDGRGAAGVLGTEVPVAEILAGEMARFFIERFASGQKAGEALLDVRRELLAKKNPLGLVYTLYAPATLAVSTDANGP